MGMSRRFQFSLTWLVIASLVIGAFFGGISVGRRSYELENQREKAELLRERENLVQMMLRKEKPGDMYITPP